MVLKISFNSGVMTVEDKTLKNIVKKKPKLVDIIKKYDALHDKNNMCYCIKQYYVNKACFKQYIKSFRDALVLFSYMSNQIIHNDGREESCEFSFIHKSISVEVINMFIDDSVVEITQDNGNKICILK